MNSIKKTVKKESHLDPDGRSSYKNKLRALLKTLLSTNANSAFVQESIDALDELSRTKVVKVKWVPNNKSFINRHAIHRRDCYDQPSVE